MLQEDLKRSTPTFLCFPFLLPLPASLSDKHLLMWWQRWAASKLQASLLPAQGPPSPTPSASVRDLCVGSDGLSAPRPRSWRPGQPSETTRALGRSDTSGLLGDTNTCPYHKWQFCCGGLCVRKAGPTLPVSTASQPPVSGLLSVPFPGPVSWEATVREGGWCAIQATTWGYRFFSHVLKSGFSMSALFICLLGRQAPDLYH